MICPACGHNNKPGAVSCSLCTASLHKFALLKNIPKKTLLGTPQKSNRLFFYLCISVILIFFYYIFSSLYNFQTALREEENSTIQQQILQRKAALEYIADF